MFGKTSMTDSRSPSPPEKAPQYLVDGIPKQDAETLTELQSWIDELLVYRSSITDEDIEADAEETIEDIEETDDGTIVIKKVPCGKESCTTCPHGPYKYTVQRREGGLDWTYQGPTES